MPDDANYTTLTDMSRALDNGVTAVDLVERSLQQIARRNDEVNAVIALRGDAALVEAKNADSLPRTERGPLHGVPILVKDLNEMTDLPTTYGSRAFAGETADFEALVVTRLRAAGAIVVGKTNTPEFGLRPTTDNAIFGSTRNPYSLEHTAGGSSGGAAAALATGMVPIALGGDGGGSCRIPASCCGVVGMRPSRGLIPWAPIAYEYWGALATNGPMARTVADARTMLDVMAGPVVGEPYGVSIPIRSASAVDRPLRIAVAVTPPHGTVDDEVVGVVRKAQATLSALGHQMEEIELDLTGLRTPWEVVVEANVAMTAEHAVGDANLSNLESNTLALALRGRQRSAADYAHAIHEMRNRSALIMQGIDQYDVVLTPTLTRPPLPLEVHLDTESHDERWTRYLDWLAFTYPINCTGQPAISIPGGTSRQGLPIGIQFIGRMGDDAGVLAIADAFEAAQPWHHSFAQVGGNQ